MTDPEGIFNWRRLDDRITTSGQPTETQLADIHALVSATSSISPSTRMTRRSRMRRAASAVSV